MIESLGDRLMALSPPLIIALVILGILQVILQVFCVRDLIRRPAVTGGNKWLWGLLIVAGGLIGCLLYFGLGRNPTVLAEDSEAAGDSSATRRAIDKLYGDKS